MEKRNVPAQDATTTPKPWPLSKSQWALYYWLLGHSNWNSFTKEDHYYIYRNSFTNVQIMKQTGIKSKQTILTGFNKLLEVGAIEKSEFHDDAYLIHTTHLYVPMNAAILRYLLAFNNYLDPALVITTFAILVRLSIFEKGKPIDFTKTTLSKLLGLAKQNVDDAGIILVLALLEHSGLIALNRVEYTNTLGVQCMRYTLVKTDTEGKHIEAMLNEDREISDNDVISLWNKILSVTGN